MKPLGERPNLEFRVVVEAGAGKLDQDGKRLLHSCVPLLELCVQGLETLALLATYTVRAVAGSQPVTESQWKCHKNHEFVHNAYGLPPSYIAA